MLAACDLYPKILLYFHLMSNLLLKQFWYRFKDNIYVGLVTILGTALSICLIMVYLIAGFLGKTVDLSPENNRHRTLYVKWAAVENKQTGMTVGAGFLSLKTIKECFETLEIPEKIIVTSPLQSQLASLPGDKQRPCFVLPTDDVFWQVFDFKILAGKPYDHADFKAGFQKVILNKEMATFFYGSVENAVGKQIQLNYHPYTVSAVVNNVPTMASATYGQAWVPFTCLDIPRGSGIDGINGRYKCQILARSSSDFQAIREEVNRNILAYNETLGDYSINLHRQPDTKLVEEDRFGYGYPDMPSSYLNLVVIIAVVLLVPAINISGFSIFRMRERQEELAVRKTYGATRWMIYRQILNESMIYSLIGGILGWGLSYAGLYLLKDMSLASGAHWGLNVQTELPPEIAINPYTFFAVLFFCTLLNILSAGIPAWRISKLPVVESLKTE